MPMKPKRAPLRRAVGAGVVASLALGKIACGAGEGTPTTVELPTTSSTEAPPSAVEVAALRDRLREAAVLTSAPARGTLYTWTSREQIDELARDRVLLTRTESPEHGPALYDQMLAKRASYKDAMAKRLSDAAFARARHAWSNPWATLLGWPGESYGDQLVVIELKPEAWTAAFVTSSTDWHVYDKDNHEVPIMNAIREPERIGAVYFVYDGEAAPPDRPAFREYVLCNEAMIARWSIGEPVAPVLAASADLAEGLASSFRGRARPNALHVWNRDVAFQVWRASSVPEELAWTYAAALAFPNTVYTPTSEAMSALAARLRGITPSATSLVHVVGTPPPALAAVLAPPPPPPAASETLPSHLTKPPPKRTPPTGTWARRKGTY